MLLLVGFSAPVLPGESGDITSEPFTMSEPDVHHDRLFSVLPPGVTNIAKINRYDDERIWKWDELFIDFSMSSIGSGVCVGDYDQDGRPDIYAVGKMGENNLYRQTGDFVFEDVTEKAGVQGGETWGTGATFADVDNDGDLDLYVCQVRARDILYINQGDGTFRDATLESGLDLVAGSVMASFADYDRDGDLDFYLVTSFNLFLEDSTGGRDYLYRNNGDGSFTDVSLAAGISRQTGFGHTSIWWDYDRDGWPDLYVANDYDQADYLYRNNGDGGFTNIIGSAIPHTPFYSMGADIADLNNDGLVDLFATDMLATTHFKQKVQMGEEPDNAFAVSLLPTPQYMRNALYLNSGMGYFMEAAYLAELAATDWTWSPKFGDLNNDGWVDLFIANGQVRNYIHADDFERNSALFEGESGGQALVDSTRADPILKEKNLAFINRGDLVFEEVGSEWGLDHLGVSTGSALADLDRDGDLDLLYSNLDAPLSVCRNNSQTGNRVLIQLLGTSSNRFGIGSEVRVRSALGTQVRYLTLASGVLSANEPLLHFGLGDDAVISELSVSWPSGKRQVYYGLEANRFYHFTEPEGPVADQPADSSRQRSDTALFAATGEETGLNFVHAETWFDDFKKQSLVPNQFSQLGPGLAWGDPDGDGRFDLFVGGAAGQKSRLFQNRGGGIFEETDTEQAWDSHSASEDLGALWLDVDGDGDDDLYVATGSNEFDEDDPRMLDRIYLNDGSGAFAEAPNGTLPDRRGITGSVVAADYDRDGDLDLFVGGRVIEGKYPLSPDSFLLENQDGTFVDVTDDYAPELRKAGLVTGALWTDADDDGHLDLMITREWGSVAYFRNSGEGFVDATEGSGLGGYLGWWNSIAGSDFEGDGDIDYVVCNVGLNTKYHASPARPVTLYYGDMHQGGGGLNLIEATYEGEVLYPVRGKSCSTGAMPLIAEKFKTYASFASASVFDIYQPNVLADSTRMTANMLSSGVFLNDGQGRFEYKPLPRIAQVSPGYGVAAQDFNGDGNADICFVQNFFGPQVETGRFDGGLGLVLLGDGDGAFEPLPAQRSGLVVPGDAKGLTVCDLDEDGWPDLVASRNNDSLSAFVNRHQPDNQSFSVKLIGETGNRHAIGSKITLHYSNGRQAAAELSAGSGYLSQSQPLVFFGYRPDTVPTTINVRWPDGTVTKHAWDSQKRLIEIRRPSGNLVNRGTRPESMPLVSR
jgi:YD repeat-containing protein